MVINATATATAIQAAGITKESILQLSQISFTEYLVIIKPLLLYIVGISIYAIFVFKFYKYLAKRDMVQLGMHKYSEGFTGILQKVMWYVLNFIENVVLIPILVFFWFVGLAAVLMFLSKNQSPNTLLLIAVAVVAAIRITSYYKEELSQDLAKMLPFALLGVFLLDISTFSLAGTFEKLKEIPSLWQVMIYYLVLVMSIEFFMRILQTITGLILPSKKEAKE